MFVLHLTQGLHSCNKELMLEQEQQALEGKNCLKCPDLKKENIGLNFTLNETDKKLLDAEKENGHLQKQLDKMITEQQYNV
jgi:hypothetical protein